MSPKTEPTDLFPHLDILDELPPTESVRITTAKRRYGKLVTIIDGFAPQTDMRALTKRLKSLVAAGGSHDGGTVELQGDHRERVRKALIEMGYDVKVA